MLEVCLGLTVPLGNYMMYWGRYQAISSLILAHEVPGSFSLLQ